jgi:hypothetical protein
MTKRMPQIVNGTRVLLKSFNGATCAPLGWEDDPANNYWLLVGHVGLIVKDVPSRHISPDRVLVKFDVDTIGLGLHCHNEIQNSLWIQRSDLQVCA